MTGSIGSLNAGQNANEAAGQSPAPAAGAAPAKPVEPVSAPNPQTATGGPQANEAVTLSADAQSTAQLLDAARAADGIDTAKVAQLRQSVQSGQYGPPPGDVARAITGALGGGAVTGPPG